MRKGYGKSFVRPSKQILEENTHKRGRGFLAKRNSSKGWAALKKEKFVSKRFKGELIGKYPILKQDTLYIGVEGISHEQEETIARARVYFK